MLVKVLLGDRDYTCLTMQRNQRIIEVTDSKKDFSSSDSGDSFDEKEDNKKIRKLLKPNQNTLVTG